MCMGLAWALLAAGAIASALVALALVWCPMRRILSANSTIGLARGFYTRCLGAILIFAALAGIASHSIPSADQRQAWATMEYIWWIVNGLGSVFWAIALFLLGFAVVLAVLYSVLGRERDE